MRRALVGICVLLLSGVAIGWAAGPVRAAKDAEPSTKFKAKIHGKHEEVDLDLSKPDHRRIVIEHVEQGALDRLERETQTNLLDLRWDLGLWTLVVFILLFLVLKKAAWGPILEGLQQREQDIRSAVEEAKLARAETARERAEFQRKLDEAFQKIPQMMDEARRDAQHMAEEMRAKATAEIQADRQRLRREIEMAHDQALQQLLTQMAQLATLISAKTIQRSLTEEDHRRLVDEALAELREASRNGRRG